MNRIGAWSVEMYPCFTNDAHFLACSAAIFLCSRSLNIRVTALALIVRSAKGIPSANDVGRPVAFEGVHVDRLP
jgi:hypothetical protein